MQIGVAIETFRVVMSNAGANRPIAMVKKCLKHFNFRLVAFMVSYAGTYQVRVYGMAKWYLETLKYLFNFLLIDNSMSAESLH